MSTRVPTSDPTGRASQEATSFASQAADTQRTGLLQELWLFLKYNKKWWLAPILTIMFLLAVLAVAGAQQAGIAPFIYTLF